MSRVCVTGCNGFIGSHVVRRLVSRGHSLAGLVRGTSSLAFLEDVPIDLHRGDVTDPCSLGPFLQEAELVVHVAGLAADWGSHADFERVNLAGTKNVARAAAAAGVRRFVHISTAAVHGFPNARNMDERQPTPPTGFAYCDTKRAAEEWLFAFGRGERMEVTAVRPGNVFGERDHTFIEKYLDALLEGKLAVIDGGTHWTCPVYIDNLVDGIERAAVEPGAAGEAFLITDGLDIDWRTFTGAFSSALAAAPVRRSVPYAVAYGAAWAMEACYRAVGSRKPPLLTRYRIMNGGRDYHFSIEKARRLLGFEPAVSFAEAVRRTTGWYLSRSH
jgi:nucleoside-diphosphate-sugar epimerase